MSTTHSRPTLVEPFEVVRVTDSRHYVEQGDRMVPVPGTGELLDCDRCGKGHEVHVEVVDAAGTAATVGTGCCGATRARAAQLRGKATRAAAAAARLNLDVARAAALADMANAIGAYPADEVSTWSSPDGHRTFYGVDGAKVSGFGTPADDPERHDALYRAWERRQLLAACADAGVRLSDLQASARRVREAGAGHRVDRARGVR